LSDTEIKEIEDLVNREILKNDAVNTDLKSIEEAMQSGAMALFGEKYGSQVRVLSIGEGVSRKNCAAERRCGRRRHRLVRFCPTKRLLRASRIRAITA
jgi:alanyl-tRNA synthetase